MINWVIRSDEALYLHSLKLNLWFWANTRGGAAASRAGRVGRRRDSICLIAGVSRARGALNYAEWAEVSRSTHYIITLSDKHLHFTCLVSEYFTSGIEVKYSETTTIVLYLILFQFYEKCQGNSKHRYYKKLHSKYKGTCSLNFYQDISRLHQYKLCAIIFKYLI